MKKNYLLLKLVILIVLFVSINVANANDLLKAKKIVLVGNPSVEAGDQNLFDSLSAWMTASSMLSLDFNQLDASAFDTIDCVLFSETILSTDVPAFGVDLEFPVPSVVMEMSLFDNDVDKWNLLEEDGVIEGHASPVAEDLQWVIVDNTHYITEEYALGEVVDYATGDAGRGMAYIIGFAATDVDILAEPNSTLENPGASAIAVVNDYDILFMSVAKDYPAVGVATADLFSVLKRGCEFILDVVPGEPSGIRDNTMVQDFELTAFPSPATENIKIKYVADNNYNATITIMNTVGKKVAIQSAETRHGTNYISLDVSSYASGLYFVKVQLGDKTANAKFIIK